MFTKKPTVRSMIDSDVEEYDICLTSAAPPRTMFKMARGSSPDTDMMDISSAPRNDSLGAAPDSDSDGYNSPVEELKAFSSEEFKAFSRKK